MVLHQSRQQAGCTASGTQPARPWRRSLLCFPRFLIPNAGVSRCISKLNFQLLQQKEAIKVSATLETVRNGGRRRKGKD